MPEIPSSVRVLTVRNPGYAPRCAPGYGQNHQAGNLSVNTSIPVTNNLGSLQDAGVTSAITRELQKLKDMISSVPGVTPPKYHMRKHRGTCDVPGSKPPITLNYSIYLNKTLIH